MVVTGPRSANLGPYGPQKAFAPPVENRTDAYEPYFLIDDFLIKIVYTVLG